MSNTELRDLLVDDLLARAIDPLWDREGGVECLSLVLDRLSAASEFVRLERARRVMAEGERAAA